MKQLDEIRLELRSVDMGSLTVYVSVWDNSLARKWLTALNQVLRRSLHLEKNYCFMGFPNTPRNGWFILERINRSIQAINSADLGYHISDLFSMADVMEDEPRPRTMRQDRMNNLHRYFEDLQGHQGYMSTYWQRADAATRWHIRQLNLLCHEFESWALSYRKSLEAPDWVRPSQLMCWLNAPRFELDQQDFELFGVHTLSRAQGGVYVGVNKAVGKHHWEVFNDEGRDSRITELTTSALRGQTVAAADFDIEWGRDPSDQPWQQQELDDFRAWLRHNGFDPTDPSLTIGHPQVAQVDLLRSFDTEQPQDIWTVLSQFQDVTSIHTSDASAWYEYQWSDPDFESVQQKILAKTWGLL